MGGSALLLLQISRAFQVCVCFLIHTHTASYPFPLLLQFKITPTHVLRISLNDHKQLCWLYSGKLSDTSTFSIIWLIYNHVSCAQLDKTQSQNKNIQLLVVLLIAKYNAHNLFSSDFLYSLHYLLLAQSQNKNIQLLVVHLTPKYNTHNLFSSDFLYSLHYLLLCINPWFIVGENSRSSCSCCADPPKQLPPLLLTIKLSTALIPGPVSRINSHFFKKALD